MTNTQKNLESRYKDTPGKIILRKDGIAIACDTEQLMTGDDLALLQKQHQQTSFDPASRMKWLKVATSDPDRAGDEMVIDGCETDNFLRNPQFLWMHGQTSEPVHTLGKIQKLVKTPSALYALAEYAEQGVSDFADGIFDLDSKGYLPANSIGFNPIEWQPNEYGGFRFTKWELIEISKVELPCNPYAIDDGGPATKGLSISEAAELI